MNRLPGRLIVCLCFLVVLGPITARAQSSKDLLDKVRQQREVLSQKTEAEVRQAIADARQLAASDPGESVRQLESVLARVQADSVLPTARREALVRSLEDLLRTLRPQARAAAKPESPSGTRLSTEQQPAADDPVVGDTLRRIDELQKAGRTAEAAQLSAELARRNQKNLPAQASDYQADVSNRVATARNLAGDRDRRSLDVFEGVARATRPPSGDIEFPPDWAEKTERRKSLNGPRLTAKEREILKALETPITVDYDQAAFGQVIEDLATRMNQPIVLDKAALENALVTSDSPVTLKLRNAQARTVLRSILKDLGLSYLVKEEAIQVVSVLTARNTMVTRTYYLGDIIAGGAFANAGIRFVPSLDQIQMMQNVASLIRTIQSVEPDSWDVNGGPGSVTFSGATMSLIVRQSAEVHGILEGSLR